MQNTEPAATDSATVLHLRPDSGLSGHNRFTILKTVIQPIAFYGKEVWVTEPPQVKEVSERTQDRLLCHCLDAPWYVRNQDIRKDADLEHGTADSRFRTPFSRARIS